MNNSKQQHWTNYNVKQDCHPGNLVAGVSLGYVRKDNEQAICIERKSAGDPGQKPSGMTTLFHCQVKPDLHIRNRAFTLIELLVVVLIIGILAAVALPQYQKAVDSSRFIQLLSAGKAVKDAQEIYFIRQGEYATSLQDLDIDASNFQKQNIQFSFSKCVKDGDTENVTVSWNKLNGVFIRFSYAWQCQGMENWRNDRTCFARTGNSRANTVCAQAAKSELKTNCPANDYCRYYNF